MKSHLLCLLSLGAALAGACADGSNTLGPTVVAGVGVDGGAAADGELPGSDGVSNQAPSAVEFHLEPDAPTTADPVVVVLDGLALDPDRGPEALEVEVVWLLDGVVTLYSSLELPPTATARGQVWTAEVRGWDGQDLGPTREAQVEIVNSVPTTAAPTVTPASPDTASLLVCDVGDKNDPDGDEVSVSWSWAIDETLVDGEETSAMMPPLLAGASYRCGATAFDGQASGETLWSGAVIPEEAAPEPVFEGLLLTQPKALDLGVVIPGEMHSESVQLTNIGIEDFDITGLDLTGSEGFDVDIELPITLAPDDSASVTVTFATDQPGLHKGTLSLDTTAANPQAGVIQLLGVGAAPCLKTQPGSLDFGGTYVATNSSLPLEVISCGALPVVVDDITLEKADGAPFTLDLSAGPGDLPWSLGPGEVVEIAVRFEPLASSPVDEDGNPILEEATVTIDVGVDQGTVVIPVTAFASEAGCPTPVIHVAEGHMVAPGTVLHLDATGSLAAGGLPSVFSWAVLVPAGAALEAFDPAANVPTATYPVDTLGTYQFSLKVFDEVDGDVVSGCSTALWNVTVKDAMPLIVELIWDTPGDANQSDQGPGVGADLDLHVHRGGGTGPDYDGDGVADAWFDPTQDVYWLDTSPDWGEPGGEDDPLLAIEDPDGQGPEAMHHGFPLPGGLYTVGVHGWSDYGFGPSVATVRVYHFEELVAEVGDVVLGTGDLWEAGVISWPKCELTETVGSGGGPKVTAGYPNPFQ